MNLSLVKIVLNEYFKAVILYKNVNIDEVNTRCISLVEIGKNLTNYEINLDINAETKRVTAKQNVAFIKPLFSLLYKYYIIIFINCQK